MSVNPIPEGFHSVNPHIPVENASEAIEFYKKAFGAEELCRMAGPGGMLMHAEIKIGDSVVMLHDAMPQAPSQSPKTLGGPSCVLALYTADCDAAIQQAVDAGAELKMPATDMFWGDRYGMIGDPYGHVWSIATHKEDLTPEQLQERAEQFFSSGAASEGCEGP